MKFFTSSRPGFRGGARGHGPPQLKKKEEREGRRKRKEKEKEEEGREKREREKERRERREREGRERERERKHESSHRFIQPRESVAVDLPLESFSSLTVY